MASPVREKIISYLGQGISQIVTAEACGVSAGYVSQLLDEEGVRQEVAKVRAGKLQRDMEVDDSIGSIEKEALDFVKKKLPYVKGPLEAARIFDILNGARRRSEASKVEDDGSNAQTVVLVLPKSASVMIEVNSSNQVVGVNGKSTAPLPSRQLPGMASRLLPQPGVIDVPSIALPKRAEPHVLAQKLRQEAEDKRRAASIFENLTVMQGGVELDI